MRLRVWAGAAAMVVLLSGCVTANDVAMRVGAPPGLEDGKSVVDLRAIQTRRFESSDEIKLLLAATQTLQDLGFTVTESASEVGVLVASKQRDAEESGQIAGQVVLTVLFAALGTYYNPTWDKEQTIYVTLITTTVQNSDRSEVRVSFDRRMTNNHGQQWRSELIAEPEIYQEFFQKLSEGVFLEAHTS